MSAHRIAAVLVLSASLLMPSASAEKDPGTKDSPGDLTVPTLKSITKPPPDPAMGLQPLGSDSGKYPPPPRPPLGTVPPVAAPEPAPAVMAPDIIPSTVELLVPASGERLRPNLQEDQLVTFRWRLREAYKPLEQNSVLISPYDKRWRRVKLAQTQYTLCVHSGDSCDEQTEPRVQTDPGVDHFTDPAWVPAAAGGIEREVEAAMQLVYTDWQGTSLNWSVKTCTRYIDQAIDVGMPGRIVGPICTYSESRPLHWLLPSSNSAGTRTDERYGDTWHLIFDWNAVSGADYYEICMHPTADGLDANCVAAGGVSAYPAFEERENNPGYEHFGEPPPGLGNKGDVFWWKVASCASPKLEVDVTAQCNYSSAYQSTWPE